MELMGQGILQRNRDILEEHVALVRRLDRLYERRINQLQERALINEASWAEMQVVHELGRGWGGGTAAWLTSRLHLDTGYLCRILKGLCARGVARCSASPQDLRLRQYELTKAGREWRAFLEDFYNREVLLWLEFMPRDRRAKLMQAIQALEEVMVETRMPEFCEPWKSRERKRARYRRRG